MKYFAAGFLLLLLTPAVLLAAEPSVALNEALILALERNHLVSGAAYEKEAAEEGAAASRSRYLPRIVAEEAFSASDLPTRVFMMKLDQGRFATSDFELGNLNTPSSYHDFRTALTLEQPLFDLGIGYGREMAEREAERMGYRFEGRREDVGFAVYGAYLGVQRAKAVLAAAEKDVEEAREHLRVATVRGHEGTGLKSDELRARTFLSEAEERTITALNDLKLAKMRLALAVGGGSGESLDIRGDVTGEAFRLNEEEIVRQALANRRDLKGVEKGVERAEAAMGLARSAWFPTLYAAASVQMNDRDVPFGRDNDGWSAGVNLRWEVFDGMGRMHGTARARAERDAAAQYLEQFRKEVDLQVRESILRRAEAGKRLEVARHALLAAEEGSRLVNKRFANGLVTMVELLDAQSALSRARTGLAEREADHLLATARIYHTAGIFLKEMAP
ncbi:TolC family protein [Geobacter hydrogenophilus]|uniref:RND transporter n=1 Tax=Geobacter hydrogenophilus TaxID=40983 RepID=A0A9W6FZD2_9BACT|nr:TolC family protein [Geobacter hydrogenophilus]MBT0893673.1 TolC family protein [Geobacter hydrogenophilus]GLI37630.1 RND transporter [Geobacter hydrogenophilus]